MKDDILRVSWRFRQLQLIHGKRWTLCLELQSVGFFDFQNQGCWLCARDKLCALILQVQQLWTLLAASSELSLPGIPMAGVNKNESTCKLLELSGFNWLIPNKRWLESDWICWKVRAIIPEVPNLSNPSTSLAPFPSRDSKAAPHPAFGSPDVCEKGGKFHRYHRYFHDFVWAQAVSSLERHRQMPPFHIGLQNWKSCRIWSFRIQGTKYIENKSWMQYGWNAKF